MADNDVFILRKSISGRSADYLEWLMASWEVTGIEYVGSKNVGKRLLEVQKFPAENIQKY